VEEPEFRFLAGSTGISLLQNIQTCHPAHPASYTIIITQFCQEIKWQALEVDHDFPSNANAKNEWSYTPILQYAFMAHKGINVPFVSQTIQLAI
jgi:hypothetical protein